MRMRRDTRLTSNHSWRQRLLFFLAFRLFEEEKKISKKSTTTTRWITEITNSKVTTTTTSITAKYYAPSHKKLRYHAKRLFC